MARDPLDLLYGSLDLLILRNPRLGAHARLRHLELHPAAHSRGARDRRRRAIQEPAPHRAKGFIEGEWGATEENRRAKFYKLTAAGRAALRAETSAWNQYVDAVHKVLEPA